MELRRYDRKWVYTALLVVLIVAAIILILKNKERPAALLLMIELAVILYVFLYNVHWEEISTVVVPYTDTVWDEKFTYYSDKQERIRYDATAYPAFINPCLLVAGITTAFLGEKNKTNEKRRASRNITPVSNADELKKYKDLLDSGAITQAEYDEKKRQILGDDICPQWTQFFRLYTGIVRAD